MLPDRAFLVKLFYVNGESASVPFRKFRTAKRAKVVPALNESDALSLISFMQDGASLHNASPVKRFLMKKFGEDRVISRGFKIEWPPQSPDVTPDNFWLWGYPKSLVYRSSLSTSAELKNSICCKVSAIHSDLLHSAVISVVTRLINIVECAGGHVERLLLQE